MALLVKLPMVVVILPRAARVDLVVLDSSTAAAMHMAQARSEMVIPLA